MSFDPDFIRMMITGIQILPFIGMDGYGARQVGTAVATKGHITYDNKSIRTNTGDSVTVAATIEIPPPGYVVDGVAVPTVTNGSTVILPDSSEPRHILEARMIDDEQGHHHQTLFLV